MAKLLLIPSLLILCVSAASGQSAPKSAPKPKPVKETEEVTLTCKPQKPLSHTWICTDQNGNERNNLIIKDRDAK